MKISLKYIYLLYGITLTGVGLALYRSWSPYSFWMDELGSVSMSIMSFPDVWRAIVSDVHPPMFQFLLKLWVYFFGSWEPVVRFFSLLCCLSAAGYLFYKTRMLSNISRWMVVTIFTSCFLFPFYAQEARSYGLALLLSTVLTGQYAAYNDGRVGKRFLLLAATALALSLTHYFGLLLAITICALLALEYRNKPELVVASLMSLCVCLVWPATHYWVGLGELKSTKNAWMVVNGPVDTGRIFFRTLFPNLGDLYLLICAGLFVFLIIYVWTKTKPQVHVSQIQMPVGIPRLASLCLTMLCGIAIVDMVTPISTERNFIVLLPAVALLWGLCSEKCLYAKGDVLRAALFVCTVVWAINSLFFANYLMALKWGPQHNWRASAQYVVDNYNNEKLYYLRNRDEPEVERVFDFYIQKLSQGRLSLERIYVEQLKDVKHPALLVLGGVGPTTFDDIKKRLEGRDITIYHPPQSLSASTGVIKF